MLSYLLTHPEVEIEPEVPVTGWSLSAAGRERAARAARLDWVADVSRIVSSAETKAQQTAAVFGDARGLDWATDPDLGENDRSATGFLPAAEFQLAAGAFFAAPGTSVRGWETAEAAQRRIVRAVLRWTARADVPTVYVSHGLVGTLLWCALSGMPIASEHYQPGQGSWYAFDPMAWNVAHPWRRVELA